MKITWGAAIGFALFAGACNSGGVVQIGPNQYMLGGIDVMGYSGSAVKARYYQDAAAFCAAKGLVLQATGSTGVDSGPGTAASAEIQFSCIPAK